MYIDIRRFCDEVKADVSECATSLSLDQRVKEMMEGGVFFRIVTCLSYFATTVCVAYSVTHVRNLPSMVELSEEAQEVYDCIISIQQELHEYRVEAA